jgi:hypothetical protein
MTIKKAVKKRTAGLKQFIIAGRPTAAQFMKVYGKKGPAMTWAKREAAGDSAAEFQAALAKKVGK